MHDRRQFLAGSAAACLAPSPLGGEGWVEGADPRESEIKIGCLSWCFHPFAPGADQEAAVDVIGPLGFDGVELILLARQDLKDWWTDARVAAIRKKLDQRQLALPQFVLFQPVVEGLTSTDQDVRAKNLDWFEQGAKLGKRLGAPMVNIVAPWPTELRRPGGGYLPRHYDLVDGKPGELFRIEIDPQFDWDAVWAGFVDAVKGCLERVKALGMKLSIEHHTHCLVPEAASFLRLWEELKDPALGYNLDTGWTLLQREHPAVAMRKTKRHLFNVHVRDIDPAMRKFVHFGTGVMDFAAVVETAKRIGYRGYLSLEQDKPGGDMLETVKRYLKTMRELTAG